jgi:hypothetical protein
VVSIESGNFKGLVGLSRGISLKCSAFCLLLLNVRTESDADKAGINVIGNDPLFDVVAAVNVRRLQSLDLEWHGAVNLVSSNLGEMDWSSLLIEVEEGAVAEAILWAEQETEIIMFAISCLLLANYKSLQLYL